MSHFIDPFAASRARGERDSLPSLPSVLPLNRRPRPAPLDLPLEPAPPNPPHHRLKRQTSRAKILGLFSRSKAHPARPLPLPPSTGVAQTPAPSLTPTSPASLARPRPSPLTLQPRAHRLISKSSRASLVARSPLPDPRPPYLAASWEPPPLFQAYPQAVKHASLATSMLSPESILRANRSNAALHQQKKLPDTSADSTSSQATAARKREEKARNKHRRRLSGSISKAEWTQKIYVLTTSGYLLQYTSNGAFDRLPEQILQLNVHSAAFACDVIPNKHFVVQVSQALNDDGTPLTKAPKSLMSKLSFRKHVARHTQVSSFLLVLESPQDMDSWLTAIRQEIEALGGKACSSPRSVVQRAAADHDLHRTSSRSYLIKKEPSQFSLSPHQHQPRAHGYDATWLHDTSLRSPGDISEDSSRRPSWARQSLETHSITTAASSDQLQLDRLRHSSRLSYMSSSGRTLTTSRASSPAQSPVTESFAALPSTNTLTPATHRKSLNGALPPWREGVEAVDDLVDELSTPLAGSRPEFYMASTTAGPSPSFPPATHLIDTQFNESQDIGQFPENITRPSSTLGSLPSSSDLRSRSRSRVESHSSSFRSVNHSSLPPQQPVPTAPLPELPPISRATRRPSSMHTGSPSISSRLSPNTGLNRKFSRTSPRSITNPVLLPARADGLRIHQGPEHPADVRIQNRKSMPSIYLGPPSSPLPNILPFREEPPTEKRGRSAIRDTAPAIEPSTMMHTDPTHPRHRHSFCRIPS
ncbi:MAG: hypothetical protein M1829_002147 [Trizodia sp. TS-e1964]|nr:MAG: hypothetical protein M1829_002147 [Trizodia sp. TS-e1964]